ncbi:DNA polymerase III subunit gamma/tau [Bordetella sp. FB-8]|uniref:DNA polymerase III subunit gamma/tau n=1 Tax=Bordetella sp. FB-8 TaxID=1159870 RepID=UPI00035E97A1|nr:DNA polymerase III subunit gamma/tau [Bordetella sp. FB-8]
MTYLVLARKWRPRSFDTLVGQDHVVRALTHALQTQRLHHAWLFTGTRGVGKTTLSRILAKSLNCEIGITPTPCGVCRACTEIDAGRFVDYLELDAASNRGVDEMTQLLEQAVYAPGAGRFKVYMIDEVHMLTGHAFNAMLKTLEEPPPHVKFILATTDPQKIPATVLSRCLQFNLKQMPPEAIVGHLQNVLGQESIPFEVPALRLIGQVAAGSMRDALSLTDQAIAYSAGDLTEEAVRAMLGTIDQRHLARLLDALCDGDAPGVLAVADELSTRGLSYAGALADLAVLLSRIAIVQRVPGALPADDPMTADIVRLAQRMHADTVQLFYSVAVHSRAELTLAPDEYAGFIMTCLRMLALNGDAGPAMAAQAPTAASTAIAPADTVAAPAAAAEPKPVAAPLLAPTRPDALRAVAAVEPPLATRRAGTPVPTPIPARPPASTPPWEDLPVAEAAAAEPQTEPAPESANPPNAGPAAQSAASEPALQSEPPAAPAGDEPPSWVDEDIPDDAAGYDTSAAFTADPDDEFETLADSAVPRANTPRPAIPARAVRRPASQQARPADMTPAAWPELAARLPLSGLAAELARQSAWAGLQGDTVTLRVAVKTLAESESRTRLQTVLCEHYSQSLRLEIAVGATGEATAHAVAQQERAARQQAAEDATAADPFVQALISSFGARVVPGSIRPVDPA